MKIDVFKISARILIIIFVYLLIAGIFQYIVSIAVNIPIELNENLTIDQHLILAVVDAIVLFIVVFTFRKQVDKKNILSMGFGLHNALKDVFKGFIVAFLILGIGTFLIYNLDEVRFVKERFQLNIILKYFFLFIITSLIEEILMRGYILKNLLTVTNKYVALTFSALIFSLMHIFNTGMNFLSFINLFLAGILLGAAYMYTKNLWFPISLHFFWNFIEGAILGYKVSGEDMISLYRFTYFQNNHINGGDFGFEGSIVCTMLKIAFITIIIYGNKEYSDFIAITPYK